MPLNINALSSTLDRNALLGGRVINSWDPKELTNKESNDARDQLLTMRDHLKGKTGRIRCSNLAKGGISQNDNLTIKRGGWFKGMFTSTSQESRTNAYIKTTIENAYRHRLPEQQFKALQQELSTYINDNHSGVGSRHFVSFIERFEQAIDRAPLDGARPAQGNAPANPGRVVPAIQQQTVSQLGQRVHQGNFDVDTGEVRGRVSGPEARGLNLEGVKALTGDANARALASGVEASVYAARRNGEDVVIRIPSAKSEASIEDLRAARSGDVAAAKKAVKNPMPHVSTPSSYVIKCTPLNGAAQTYEVSPQELPQLLRLVRGQQLEILATVMPLAQGQSLDKFKESVPQFDEHNQPVLNAEGQVQMKEQAELSGANAQKLSVGLALGMEELRKNNLVHHDIKPANVMFDPQGGVKLVDLGGISRLSRNEQKPQYHQTTNKIGSPPLQSPWVAKGQPHSHEADRYSFAMTLLGSLDPKLLQHFEGSTEAVKNEQVADQAREAAIDKLGPLNHAINNATASLEIAQEDLEQLQVSLNAIVDDPNQPDVAEEVAKKKAEIQKEITKKQDKIHQLQAELASKTALRDEAQQAVDEATRLHDEAKAALVPVVFHKNSSLRFLFDGKGPALRPNAILNTFVSELARFDPAAAQALEAKLDANDRQLRKIIDGAFMASEPGENSHLKWAQVLEHCITATQDPQEQAALRQAIDDLNTEATRLKDSRVGAFRAALSAPNANSASAAVEKMMERVGPAYAIGVAEIVDAIPAANLVTANDRILESEEELAIVSQDDGEGNIKVSALPKHLLFIPGSERLDRNASELEIDLKKAADASIGKPAVDTDFNVAKDDPRLKQFAKDALGSRALPLILSNGDDLSSLPIDQRWPAFMQEINRFYPHPVEAENARRELPQLLHQGLSAQFMTHLDSPVAMDMDSRNIRITGRDADGWLKINVTGEFHGLDTGSRPQLIKLRRNAGPNEYAVQEFNHGKSYTTRQEYAIEIRYKPSNQALAQEPAENQDAVANPAAGNIRVDKMMMGFKVTV